MKLRKTSFVASLQLAQGQAALWLTRSASPALPTPSLWHVTEERGGGASAGPQMRWVLGVKWKAKTRWFAVEVSLWFLSCHCTLKCAPCRTCDVHTCLEAALGCARAVPCGCIAPLGPLVRPWKRNNCGGLASGSEVLTETRKLVFSAFLCRVLCPWNHLLQSAKKMDPGTNRCQNAAVRSREHDSQPRLLLLLPLLVLFPKASVLSGLQLQVCLSPPAPRALEVKRKPSPQDNHLLAECDLSKYFF